MSIQELLVENDPARYFVPAYMGVRGWVGARLDGTIDWNGIEQLAREGHGFAAPAPRAARARSKPFRAKLEPVPHGGQYVVVPAAVAERAGLRHAARVRGRVNGVPYRSSLMKYSGIFHLGVHKAVLAEAGVKPGARVVATIELDDQPLPADVLPDDLAAALKRSARAARTWEALRPSRKREHVKAVTGAKQAETRARRVAKVIAELLAR
jgi:hypothetical protein